MGEMWGDDGGMSLSPSRGGGMRGGCRGFGRAEWCVVFIPIESIAIEMVRRSRRGQRGCEAHSLGGGSFLRRLGKL